MAYNNYGKTNYGAQGADDGGGYMGASQQGSQGGGGGGREGGYQNESLRPVTIKQLLDVQEAYPNSGEQTMDGRVLAQLTLIGQVRQISPQPTNVTFRLDDGTGSIDVKKWIDPQKMDEENMADLYPLDSYVRVWGRLKIFSGRRHVGAIFMRPVDDFNEVNYHLLEAAYVHLSFANGKPAGAQGGGGGGQGGNEDSMFVDGYGDSHGAGGTNAKARGCSSNAQRIFAYMQNQAAGNDGMEANVIAKGTGIPVNTVEAAAEELLVNGLIYTTVDDHTWAVLDY